MGAKFPLRIRYEYEQGKDTRLRYAHGIWGGINPTGEIELNFYIESDKLPRYTESVIEADWAQGPEVIPDSAELKSVVRHVHSRVVVNYHTAKAILAWLEEKIETLESEGGNLHGIFEDGSLEQ